MAYTLKEYTFWLERLRAGHDAFIAEQELESGEDDRKLLAVNILIAYNHLAGPDSPFKDQLTGDDMRIVAIARAFNDDMPAGRVM